MPFLMIRNDITKVAADAIVNPANRNLLQGSGTSRAIYQAAGEQELTAACEAIGRCDLGRAVCTPAFGLSAKYVFHAVCPAWHGGGFGEAEQLAGAYHSALELAAEYHCESVAFPLLSSGNYGYPKEQAFRIAVGLHLSEDETIDLLKSAGYAFSDGSKRDWIVRYCLEHKIYNINQVNTLLFEYDQEQLGA